MTRPSGSGTLIASSQPVARIRGRRASHRPAPHRRLWRQAIPSRAMLPGLAMMNCFEGSRVSPICSTAIQSMSYSIGVSRGFNRLFKYISGANDKNKTVSAACIKSKSPWPRGPWCGREDHSLHVERSYPCSIWLTRHIILQAHMSAV